MINSVEKVTGKGSASSVALRIIKKYFAFSCTNRIQCTPFKCYFHKVAPFVIANLTQKDWSQYKWNHYSRSRD